MVWRHQFFGALPSLRSSSPNHTLPLGRPWPWLCGPCWQSNVSGFQHTIYVCHSFPAKKQTSSDFTAAVTIHSDLRAQEEICHCFPLFPICLPWSNGAGCHDLGDGNGNLLQYSCLENPMDGGAWWASVYRVMKSWTWLSNFTFHFHALEKEMATHSSVLAWRIPGMAEPGGLLSMGSHRVGHDWSDLAAAAAMILVFLIFDFKPTLSLFSFTSSRGSSVSLHFLPLEWYHLCIWGCWYFTWKSWF